MDSREAFFSEYSVPTKCLEQIKRNREAYKPVYKPDNNPIFGDIGDDIYPLYPTRFKLGSLRNCAIENYYLY